MSSSQEGLRVRLADGGTRAVGTILAVGRSYAAHARELGNAVPDDLVLFSKAGGSLWDGSDPVRLPFARGPIHHEVEMVLLVGRRLQDATPGEARAAVAGVAVGLDLTLRELQGSLKGKGLPWLLSKSFPNAAIVSPFAPAPPSLDLQSLELSLEVGGAVRQSSSTSLMLWSAAELLSLVSTRMPVLAGDLLFTGTPEGVAPLLPGDRLVAKLSEVARLELTVA